MKISNEAKIGIFATLTIIAAFLGYNFLKGKSVLSKSITLYTDIPDAKQLPRSAPIFFRGVEVGNVQDLFFKTDGKKNVTLALNFKQNPGIPKNATAMLFANGVLGGTAVELLFDHMCENGDCAENGDYIKGSVQGKLEGYIGKPKDIAPYMDTMVVGITKLIDALSDNLKKPDNEVGKSLRDIQVTLVNMRQATASLSQLMAASSGTLKGTLQNVESITGNLNANNDKVSKMLSNFSDVSGKANTLDFSKINAATEGVGQSVDELKKTLTATQNSLAELTNTIKKINSGQGTVGQLATNDSVYTSLNLTLLHTQALMQDLRLNPKRYINLNPFKKYKTYQVPSQDPLLDTLQRRFNSIQKIKN
jgi:phospholipid/cholesterol/gamma-HCH transport system substrate-binding protein